MDIAELQAYGYLFLVGFLVFVLYGYIYHLYTAKKKIGKDYEKYGDIALNDNITDKPVEEVERENSASNKEV